MTATVAPPAVAAVVDPPAANPATEVAVSARVITDEDIRIRAYFLSIEHRGQGSPEYFWSLAERELRERGRSR